MSLSLLNKSEGVSWCNPDGFSNFVVDRAGTILSCSKDDSLAAEIFHKPAFFELFPDEIAAEMRNTLGNLFNCGQPTKAFQQKIPYRGCIAAIHFFLLDKDKCLITVHFSHDWEKIEAELAFRQAFENLITRISTRFIRLAPAAIDSSIDEALKEIGTFCSTDRSYIFLFDDDKLCMNNTHEWCRSGIEAQKDNLQGIPCDIMPWWMRKLENNETIHVPSIDEMPPEADTEKKILEAQNIQSLMVVPMVFENRLVGFLGFDAVREKVVWSEESIQLLQLVGAMFVNAIERKRAEAALRESEDRWAAAFAGNQDGIWDWNAETNRVFFSPRWKEMLGFEAHEISDCLEEWKSRIHPEDFDRVMNEIDLHLSGKTAFYNSQHRLKCKDGSYKWILDRGRVCRWKNNGSPLRVIGTHTDITDQKRIEFELKAREAYLRAMINTFPYLVWVKNSSGRFIAVNVPFALACGKERPPEIEGKTDLDVWPYELGKKYQDDDELVMRSRCRKSVEELIEDKGSRKWFETFKAPIIDESGEVLGTTGFSRDITERKLADQLVQRERQLFESGPVVVFRWVASPDWPTEYLSPNIEQFGYDQHDFISGKISYPNLIYHEDLDRVDAGIKALLDGERDSIDQTYRIKLANGSVRWVYVFTTSVKSADGRITNFDGYLLDITVSKQIKEEMENQEVLIQSLLDSIPDVIFYKNLNGVYLGCNPSFAKVVGKPREEIVGQTDFDLFEKDVAAFFREQDVKMLNHGGPRLNEELVKYPDGSQVLLDTLKCPLKSSSGEIIGLLGVSRDVTQRKKFEDALKQKTIELERSNAELEQFAYIASHDLQEPLRVITSYLQLLQRRFVGNLDPDINDFIGFTVDAAARMKKLINDLLEYSRVATRSHPFQHCDLDAQLNQALNNLEMAIAETGTKIVRGKLPSIEVDPTQMIQLFQNLIANAIKFRREVKPIIEISHELLADELIISFKDNGIGIEKRHYDKVFQLFQKLHGGGKYPGSGLGLAICKKIVDRHHGRITIESIVGEGTVFHLTIPLTQRSYS